MRKVTREEILTDNPLKVMFILSFPVMISQFLRILYHLADTFWLGHLPPAESGEAVAGLQISRSNPGLEMVEKNLQSWAACSNRAFNYCIWIRTGYGYHRQSKQPGNSYCRLWCGDKLINIIFIVVDGLGTGIITLIGQNL